MKDPVTCEPPSWAHAAKRLQLHGVGKWGFLSLKPLESASPLRATREQGAVVPPVRWAPAPASGCPTAAGTSPDGPKTHS